MKADVYRNLRKKCMSVRSRERKNYGRVVDHTNYIVMRDCTFIVNEAGHAKVLQTKRKNVHAFIRGNVVLSSQFPPHTIPEVDKYTEVTYNPYYCDTFVIKDWNEDYCIPVQGADVVIVKNNKVYAK